MKILGIATQHDSGAAIFENGKCLAAVNEERLSRKKLHTGFPTLSLQEVFRISGVHLAEIDQIAMAGLIPLKEEDWDWFDTSMLKALLQSTLNVAALRKAISTPAGFYLFRKMGESALGFGRNREFAEMIRQKGLFQNPLVMDHHKAHLYSAIATSPWPEESILAVSLDANGDGYCSKVAVFQKGEYREVHGIPFFHSPAHYYGYVTHLLGFRQMYHEGKVTGLAAYGDASKTLKIFQSRIAYNAKQLSFENRGHYIRKEINYLKDALAGFSREDISAGIQKHLEDLVTAYIRDLAWAFAAGRTKLVLAGGVFANVKLNQRIAALPEIEGVSIHPHMGDGGLAFGAAAAAYHSAVGEKVKFEIPTHVFWGPGFTDDEAAQALDKVGLRYEIFPDGIEEKIGKWLYEGKVVARVKGAMEYGPRALGNRSILYHAADPSVNTWLNEKLRRSEFMPFAPSILEEKAEDYVTGLDKVRHTALFMTVTSDCTSVMKSACPAVVHVDGTARPQLVSEKGSPSYHKILKAYEKLSGIPVILNTSYNIHDEPIVSSPEDAIRAFLVSELDVLALGNCAVLREANQDIFSGEATKEIRENAPTLKT